MAKEMPVYNRIRVNAPFYRLAGNGWGTRIDANTCKPSSHLARPYRQEQHAPADCSHPIQEKEDMRIPKALPAFVAGSLLALSAFGQTTATTTTVTRSSSLPPVGLAITETVQVNLTNTATASSSGTAASCTGSVAFYNAAGTIIGTATNFTLASGQISSIKLAYASAGAAGQRAVVRPVITATGTQPSTVPCSLQYSLESYDTATGVTHSFETGAGPSVPQGGFGR